jgi:hypothetical protein
MYSKSQFYALELLCRQRAAVARKEMEYWLNEAEEWTQLLNIAPSPSPLHAVESNALALEKTDAPTFGWPRRLIACASISHRSSDRGKNNE